MLATAFVLIRNRDATCCLPKHMHQFAEHILQGALIPSALLNMSWGILICCGSDQGFALLQMSKHGQCDVLVLRVHHVL